MVQVAWSPMWVQADGSSEADGSNAKAVRHAMLAVGTKSGRVWLWRYRLPGSYALRGAAHSTAESFSLVSSFSARGELMSCHAPHLQQHHSMRSSCPVLAPYLQTARHSYCIVQVALESSSSVVLRVHRMLGASCRLAPSWRTLPG